MVAKCDERQDLESSIEQIAQAGLDADRFVSIADMWGGPFKRVPGIEYVCESEAVATRWFAHEFEANQSVIHALIRRSE